MRNSLRSVVCGALAGIFFLTTLSAPPAEAVEPPFISGGGEKGGRSGAFTEVDGGRAALHVDLPGGIRADLVIPGQHNFALDDTYLLTPVEPEEGSSWPEKGAVNGKSWTGVEFSAMAARYTLLDRTLYLVFDLAGGKTFEEIEAKEPFAAFFLPYSGYFNPFLAALIKGVPIEKIFREDAAVLMPYDNSMEQQVFDFVPAISVGYDSLIVVAVRQSSAQYYPVRPDPALVSDVFSAYKEGYGTPLTSEVFRLAAGFKLDFSNLPPGVLSPGELWQEDSELIPLLRLLTGDPEAQAAHVAAFLEKTEEGGAELNRFLNTAIAGELKEKAPGVRAAASENFAHNLLRQAKRASGAPREAAEAAALSALWKDPRAAEVRKEMTAGLLEDIEYWGMEIKSGDRIRYDMVIAALLAGLDPAGFRLAGKPPSFAEQLPAELASVVERILNQETSEDEPLFAADYYGMGIIAGMAGKWERSEELMLLATKTFREEIEAMLEEPVSLSKMYRAMMWGKMVGADKNPERYRRLSREYGKSLARYEHCQKRRRKIILGSYNLKTFADQESHTRVEHIQSGVLNCGAKPRPPRVPEKDKPERDQLRETNDGLKKFKNSRKLPEKIGKVFRVKAPATPFSVPQTMFDEMLEQILDVWASALDALDVDPPRPDFQIFEEPEEAVLPPALSEGDVYDEEAFEFLKASHYLKAVLEAAVITFDRLGGAREAGEEEWAEKQLIHLEALKSDAGYALLDVAERIENRVGTLQAVDLEDESLDPELRKLAEDVTEEDYLELEEFTQLLRPLADVLIESYY